MPYARVGPSQRQTHGTSLLAAEALRVIALSMLIASCGRVGSEQPNLPKRQDVWVASLTLDTDSSLTYVGKTKDYVITDATEVRDLNGPLTISVGDQIEGIRIGAIRCSIFWKDAWNGGEQFMWRGRWGCMAGRSQEEVENAVGPEGEKRTDYLYIHPVSRSD